MKIRWLHRHDRSSLLIFCNGWGMDGAPFIPLQAHALDVLMCYDYTKMDLEQDLFTMISRYRQIFLVAWSMGVWAGQRLFRHHSDRFDRKIAVNGTLCPIHARYGIAPEVFSATLAGFNTAARLRFYHRMCRDRRAFEYFLAHQPERDIEDQRQELAGLIGKTDCCPVEASIYTDVVIADKDLIMPTASQRLFWRQGGIHPVDGHHFLFYRWNSWDAVLEDPGKNGTGLDCRTDKRCGTHEEYSG